MHQKWFNNLNVGEEATDSFLHIKYQRQLLRFQPMGNKMLLTDKLLPHSAFYLGNVEIIEQFITCYSCPLFKNIQDNRPLVVPSVSTLSYGFLKHINKAVVGQNSKQKNDVVDQPQLKQRKLLF